MARELIEAWGRGNYYGWTASGTGASTPSGVSGMGDRCLFLSGACSVKRSVTARDAYYGRIRYKMSSTAGTRVISFYNGTTLLAEIRRNTSSGMMEAYRGSTLIASGSNAYTSTATIMVIQFYYDADTTAGSLVVKVNGTIEINFSGKTVDSALQINAVKLGEEGVSSNYAYYTDIALDSAAYPSITARIQTLVPGGTGNLDDWTPMGYANNWENVRPIPVNWATYNKVNATGQVDLFATENLSGAISVLCVQVDAVALEEGTATPQNIQLAVRSGSTNYFSGDKLVPSINPGLLSNLWETDPATAAAWLVDGVDAMEIGYKAVA